MSVEDVYLLKIRGAHEDRFIVVDLETPVFTTRDRNLKWSVNEAGARAHLRDLGVAAHHIEAMVAECLDGPYFEEPFNFTKFVRDHRSS
jgi:hypothetical protein